jgi:hypothetical protein
MKTNLLQPAQERAVVAEIATELSAPVVHSCRPAQHASSGRRCQQMATGRIPFPMNVFESEYRSLNEGMLVNGGCCAENS